MKKSLKLTNLFTLAIMLMTFSCSNDDDTQVAAIITLQNLEVSIDENVSTGEVIGTILNDSNTPLTYSITSQSPAGALSIDSTGELTVADETLFDFETSSVITATVSAVGAVNIATVTINLVNVSEVTILDFEAIIDENPTNGQSIGTVQATGGTVSNFSIVSQTPAGALSINTTTGELMVADATLFDYETNDFFVANITADDAINSGLVEIELNNVNEITILEFDDEIDENPTNGQFIGTVQTTGGTALNFSIVSQTPAGAINIDANTGEITVADATLFDHETNNYIAANITVDDAVNQGVVDVQVENINELGDYNHGGVIFWLDPADDSHGLVCALDNQMEASWGCSGITTGATGATIGSGQANTTTIVATGCATGSAAEIVLNLNLNGHNDWFLPSILECTEISNNYSAYIWPTIQANGGSALFGTIWTSTETNSNSAYIYALGGGNPPSIPFPKTGDKHILPIRAF